MHEVVQEIQDKGGTAHPIQADLTAAGAADEVVAQTVEALGGLHILVNNAGMNIRKKAHEVSEEEWDRVVDLNLRFVRKTVGWFQTAPHSFHQDVFLGFTLETEYGGPGYSWLRTENW